MCQPTPEQQSPERSPLLRKPPPMIRATDPSGMGRPKYNKYIGEQGLQQLHKYNYQGEDHSLLAKYILNPFWSRFVLLLPTWVAPNTVTLAGFLFMVLSYSVSWSLSPSLLVAAPAAAAVLFSLNMFMAQTLDGVDGKQARRTESSSPLGELLDHGCDSLVATLMQPPLMAAVAGGPWRCLFCWGFTATCFFIATWETFHTDILRLPIVNGPTEGFTVNSLLLLWVAVAGHEAWLAPLPWLPAWVHRVTWIVNGSSQATMLDVILAMFLFLAAIPTVISSALVVQEAISRSLKAPEEGEEGSKGKAIGGVALTLPFWALLASTYAWVHVYPNGVFSQNPHLFFLEPCFAMGVMVGHLNLAHITKEVEGIHGKLWRVLLLQPLVLVNMALCYAHLPCVPEVWVFTAVLLDTSVLLFSFSTGVTSEVCAELGISCFRISGQGNRQDIPDCKKESSLTQPLSVNT